MRAFSVALLTTALALVGAGCGGAPAAEPAHASARPAAPPSPAPPIVGRSGVIERAALDEVLDDGIGRFLGRIEVSPVMNGETFVGFELTALHDDALFSGVDLLPGDRIVSINGQPIERPDDAFAVWTSLRVASELAIVVSRDDQVRELRFAIVD